MRIAPVSQNFAPRFNAKLEVKSGAYSRIDGESYSRFSRVMDSFREKLAADEINPEDTVVVSTIKHDSRVKTLYGPVNANLKISIGDYSSGFYYDPNRYASDIAEDLYNTYKHVRYLRHYAHV